MWSSTVSCLPRCTSQSFRLGCALLTDSNDTLKMPIDDADDSPAIYLCSWLEGLFAESGTREHLTHMIDMQDRFQQ